MTSRRAFLIGSAALIAAPAIVRAESLMKIVAPEPEIWLVDWGQDYTPDLSELLQRQYDKIVNPPLLGTEYDALTSFFDPNTKIVARDWPSVTIKAPPGGFKFVRA